MQIQFLVPTKEQVAPANQAIFDQLQGTLGFVPNLYATFAYSDTALGNYLQLQNAPTSLSKKEKEVVNLVVSEVNGCQYCQSAHTVIGKMNGFSDEQVIELRKGTASFNPKLDALVKFAKAATLQKGWVSQPTLDAFFNAGYSKANMVDVVINIAEKVTMNYLHNLTQIPIDFPLAPILSEKETMVLA